MNSLCTDIGYVCLNKCGEQLCGDRVEIVEQGDNATVVVLADGLGSGVKANILSTLTAKIISTMMANDMSIEDCVSTIAATLPVCDIRKVAYSTFTIIRIAGSNLEAELIQYDNPHIIFLRDGKHVDYPEICEMIDGKAIYKTKLKLREGDAFIAMSDGATYAGVGHALNHGWQRENIIDFAEANYLPGNSAKYIAGNIVDECNRLYEGEPGDDTTVAVVRIRARHPVNLMIGPPSTKDQDIKMMNLFFAKQGEKIICGGTTAPIASRYLHRDLKPTLDYPDPEIPPISQLDGVDLVTEGVVTISRVLKYAEDFLNGTDLSASWSTRRDGASLIARELFEKATDINFFVGRAINPAHQNPDLPITFGIKIQLIENLAKCLEKMGKQIKVSYF